MKVPDRVLVARSTSQCPGMQYAATGAMIGVVPGSSIIRLTLDAVGCRDISRQRS
jgi:hypothetical protein